MLDLRRQYAQIREEVRAALDQVCESQHFVLGPEVESFERAAAEFVGVSACVGCASGTDAIWLALVACGVEPGQEVLTTPFSFFATVGSIVRLGARAVFVDIDDSSFNIDPKQIEAAITERTKAIMPVHLCGHPADLDSLLSTCRKHKLPLVEDAAQAHGAEYRGKIVGTFGEMSCFSFYPGKNLGAYGEGGGLVTNNSDYAVRAKALRDHGSTKRYYHDEVGYNYRMEGIQGAVLGVKMKYLEKWTQERRRVAHRYEQLLADTPLQLPREADYAESAWHLYVVRHPRRDDLKKHLEANGVGCGLHYPVPLHLQKCYAHLGYKEGDFPVAEKAARECLSLPIYPEMTEEQIQRVVEVVQDFFKG